MPEHMRPEDTAENTDNGHTDVSLPFGQPGPARIIRQSLSKQAADAIKARIFALDFPPGTRLVIDNLAQELGVSRTPVREGLRELVSEGLVIYDGNSYSVITYTRRDIEDLFAIRRALEALAAAQAAQRMSEDEVEGLHRQHALSLERIKGGAGNDDTEHLIALDLRFHTTISEGSKNIRLGRLLEGLREQSWLIRRWGFLPKLVPYVEQMTLEEHMGILECLAERDSDGASRRMEEHLLKGEQRTLEWLGL